MRTEFLLNQLHSIENAKRVNREKVAIIVQEHPDLMLPLVDILFKVDDKISIKAAWILEWVCIHRDLNMIIPYLDQFTENIQHLQFDSAIRPCSKICEKLAIAFTGKKDNEIRAQLTKKHIERIVETGFDWLITPQKIAVRAFSMTALFLFGTLKGNEWIHPELKHLITTKIVHEGKGCKARGKHILEEIEKHKIS